MGDVGRGQPREPGERRGQRGAAGETGHHEIPGLDDPRMTYQPCCTLEGSAAGMPATPPPNIPARGLVGLRRGPASGYRGVMEGPAPVPPKLKTVPPGPGDLAEAVRFLRRGTALVVGDAMLDRYVFGQVTRISPEAPVPVLAVERDVALPGGAGNVVRNLTALGCAVAFVSVVGDDQAGSDLTGLIGGQPGIEPWLLVQGGRATTTKTRFVAAGQQVMRADREQTEPIHPRLADRLVRIASDAVAATGVMVLSDYRKGLLVGDTPARLIAAARGAGRRVIADPKDGDPARYAGADLLLLAAEDLPEFASRAGATEAALAAAAERLRVTHGFGAVMLLQGAESLTLAEPAGMRHLPCDAVEVMDRAGAMDALVATVAAGVSAGLSLPVAGRLGALAAGIVAGKSGIAAAREEELLDVLQPGRLAARKVASRPQAAERVERWRRSGCRVGLLVASGGAVEPYARLLGAARAWCDRLVVALPDGAAAPMATALAEHPGVDTVTRWAAEMPLDLIRQLRPDILMQDPEQAPDSVAGGELVQEWGGEIRRPPRQGAGTGAAA
jgi:D-beta-D-heptose 7-phosphate kinase/D-beta-D-heptose 1-phosphate adenosyltransferase